MLSVQISAETPILTDTVRDFHQFLHANAEMVSILSHHHFLPNAFHFTIHLPFDDIQSKCWEHSRSGEANGRSASQGILS
jgi:hypothetical protein